VNILIVSERLSRDFDDGIKNIALNLLLELRKEHRVRGMSEWEQLPDLDVDCITSNRWYLSSAVRDFVRRDPPELIIYVPWTSATFRSLFRLRALKAWSGGAKTVIVATQPMPLDGPDGALSRFLAPDLSVAMSEDTCEILRGKGFHCSLLPPGIDPQRFSPDSIEGERSSLRSEFGVSEDAFLVTHVGHVKRERFHPEILGNIAALPGVEMLVIGSPHTPPEPEIMEAAVRSGVHLVRRYVENIASIYRMSDLYLFPVRNPYACVGIPLSVIEALACGCPVLSTPFQGLPALLPETQGVIHYAADDEVLVEQVRTIRAQSRTDADTIRNAVSGFTWSKIARSILEQV
jgi:glycosyltransferase involved in cell wall biosynthesis